jgi:hypothetical protein
MPSDRPTPLDLLSARVRRIRGNNILASGTEHSVLARIYLAGYLDSNAFRAHTDFVRFAWTCFNEAGSLWNAATPSKRSRRDLEAMIHKGDEKAKPVSGIKSPKSGHTQPVICTAPVHLRLESGRVHRVNRSLIPPQLPQTLLLLNGSRCRTLCAFCKGCGF